MHLGSSVVGMSLGARGGAAAASGLGIYDLSASRDGKTKSLIFPHKVPLVGDDRFVKISRQTEKYDRACLCASEREIEGVCLCEARTKSSLEVVSAIKEVGGGGGGSGGVGGSYQVGLEETQTDRQTATQTVDAAASRVRLRRPTFIIGNRRAVAERLAPPETEGQTRGHTHCAQAGARHF